MRCHWKMSHRTFAENRTAFQTAIVNEPADGIWSGWNSAVWRCMMKLVWLAHSCFTRNLMPSFFHSAAQHKTINKHGLCCGRVFACAQAIASSTLNVDEHVSTCCGAASFHYMAQSTVCISPYPSIGGGVRTLVCVLWNVKSNSPIARLRAEKETTEWPNAAGRANGTEKQALVPCSQPAHCDCAVVRASVYASSLFHTKIVHGICAVLYEGSSAAMWFFDINSVWKWPSMLVCVSEFSSRLNNERNKFNKHPREKKKNIREKNSTPHRLFASVGPSWFSTFFSHNTFGINLFLLHNYYLLLFFIRSGIGYYSTTSDLIYKK